MFFEILAQVKESTLNIVYVGERAVQPSKVVCVGRNYVDHIQELGNELPESMVLFVKPNSAITNSLSSTQKEPLHYEGELTFLFENGRLGSVAFGLDLTKRDLQTRLKEKGLPWERAKGFDGAALFSRFVEFDCPVEDLNFQLIKNGTLVQQGHVGMMIYNPTDILTEIQSFMTLEDGDIIMTGTPKGVGVICSGDLFVGAIYHGADLLVQEQWRAR